MGQETEMSCESTRDDMVYISKQIVWVCVHACVCICIHMCVCVCMRVCVC